MNCGVLRLTQAQKNKIAPQSVLYLLCVSRLSVLLTSSQAEGSINLSGVLASLSAIPVLLLLSIPIFLCRKQGKSPFNNKAVSFFYGLYFIFLSAINIYRFSLFSAFSLGNRLNIFFFGGVLLICALYAASLGIEGFSRFAAMAFIMLLSCMLLAFVFNLKNADIRNAVPFTVQLNEFLKESAMFSFSGSELAVIFFIFPYINGRCSRHFMLSVALSLGITALTLIMCMLVLGAATQYSEYPLFTLFQTVSYAQANHLEVLFTAVFCFGILIKLTLSLFCAVKCFAKNDTKRGNIPVLFLCTAFGMMIYFSVGRIPEKTPYIIALFFIFCVIIPVLTLIFGKKREENFIEKL